MKHPILTVRSSWDVDDRGVRPLGSKLKHVRLGDASPRRQRIKQRIATYGTTDSDKRRLRRAKAEPPETLLVDIVTSDVGRSEDP